MLQRHVAAAMRGRTGAGMRIVIATAEPRGAYHLGPLRDALRSSSDEYWHVLPYDEPPQGEPVVETTADAGVISRAERVVVTGGTLSAWTELVVREAHRVGVPVLYSQLAAVGVHGRGVPVTAASSLSPADAGVIAGMLQLDEPVVVTGNPALDGMPAWEPIAKRVLLLSTSDMAGRDPGLELVRLAGMLEDDGWHVRVRCHPREDRGPWAGFEVIDGETQAESAASASVVVGYPGSAHVLAVAVGAPVVSLEPSAAFAGVLNNAEAAVMSARVVSAPEAHAAMREAKAADAALVHAAVGPVGGAAERIVAFWGRRGN